MGLHRSKNKNLSFWKCSLCLPRVVKFSKAKETSFEETAYEDFGMNSGDIWSGELDYEKDEGKQDHRVRVMGMETNTTVRTVYDVATVKFTEIKKLQPLEKAI